MTSDTPIWISAAATSVASIVALFGPGARAWWARPRVALRQPEDTLYSNDELILVSEPGDEGPLAKLQYVLLEISNHGRTQLDEVEAVLTAHQHIDMTEENLNADEDETLPSFDLPVVARGLLQFELADAQHPRLTIPAGASRALRFVFLAPDREARRELERRGETMPTDRALVCGGFALWPLAGSDRTTYLVDADEVSVEVTISARNAKAVTWRARIRVSAWSGLRSEDSTIAGVSLSWEEDLRRVRHPRTPGRSRRWLARLTPTALRRSRRPSTLSEDFSADDAASGDTRGYEEDTP